MQQEPGNSSLLLVIIAYFLSMSIILAMNPALNAAVSSETLTFMTSNREDFPHLIGDSDVVSAERPGVAVEIIRAIGERTGVLIICVRMPWKRCFKALSTGEADGLFFASYEPRRSSYGAYPMKDGDIDSGRCYSVAVYCLYRLKDSPVRWNGDKLEHFSGTIGVSRGASVGPHLKSTGYTIEESPGTLSDFEKLLRKRVQVVAALEHNGDHLLSVFPDFGEKIEKMTPPILTKYYYLVLSHHLVQTRPDLAESIWNELALVRESRYRTLVNDYFAQFSKDHYRAESEDR